MRAYTDWLIDTCTEADDWKQNDHTDYDALAAYYDELAQTQTGIDYDAEADDYAEYMADVEWMRTGC